MGARKQPARPPATAKPPTPPAPRVTGGAKFCWDCREFDFSGGDVGYSDLTPGDGVRVGCDGDVWIVSAESTLAKGGAKVVRSARDFREALSMAETCGKFRKAL